MRKTALIVIAAATIAAALAAAGPGLTGFAGPQVKTPPLNRDRIPPPLLLKPDLRVRKIWFAKFVDNPNVQPLVALRVPLKLNEKVLMICDLANEGNAGVNGLWQLGFYIDDAMLWNNSWSDLAAGATLRGIGPYTPGAEGQHRYRAFLDVGDAVKESKEDNNQFEVLFQVVR
jgi:hypothetical protein